LKESRYNIWVEYKGDHYVYNGISGSLLRLSDQKHSMLKEYLSNKDDASLPSTRLIQDLALGNMLIPDEIDELKFLSKHYESTRLNTSRFALTLVTSLGCNFDCPYCFEAKYPSIMDEEVKKAILQVIDDQIKNRKIQSLTVSWFGGEPLLGRKVLLELSDAFIKKCVDANITYSASIITNGYLLDEQTASDLHDRQVTDAQITIDGPPEIHNSMRPLVGGGDSFWTIIKNIHTALKYLEIIIRVNIGADNFGYVEKLFSILKDEGLQDQISVYPGQIVGVSDKVAAPSATYGSRCFSNREFAKAEIDFMTMAKKYGFNNNPSLPRLTGAPCTAVRSNELVVGSKGELYKCWESVGNPFEVIGNIRDYQHLDGRLHKWLKYDPFANSECRSCIALPVCMGGCAHHAMDPHLYENRCGTFRHNYKEQVLNFVKHAEKVGSTGLQTQHESKIFTLEKR